MDFIPEYYNTLSSKDKVKLLEQAKQQFRNFPSEQEEFTKRDVDLLHLYAADKDGGVRAQAVDMLAEFGPVSWDDVERWTLDEDERVRDKVFFRVDLSYNALAQLCWSDKQRTAELFAESATKYLNISVYASSLCQDDPEWADVFWSHLGSLLDLGIHELNTNIICGILEDLLAHHGTIKIDDPRLQEWITGDSRERKMALLSVVQWFGMREIWQRQIAEALTSDSDSVVSFTANCFLEHKPVPDIQDRHWAN